MTETLGGFRSHRDIQISGWLVLRVRKRKKKTLYLVSLDVSKPYDSVCREGLWSKIRPYGVEDKFVKVREGLYSGVEMRVVMNGAKSKWFGVERDLRQGWPLSPL